MNSKLRLIDVTNDPYLAQLPPSPDLKLPYVFWHEDRAYCEADDFKAYNRHVDETLH